MRSVHCWSAGLNQTTFACPARGHYPHPGNTLLYYKCPYAGMLACTCRCRYEGMCFHPLSMRCEFSFLTDIHNCSGAKTPSVQTTGNYQRKGRMGDFSDGFESQSTVVKYRARGGHPEHYSHLSAAPSSSSKPPSGGEKREGVDSRGDHHGGAGNGGGNTDKGSSHNDLPVLLSAADRVQRLNERLPQARRQVAHHASFAARQASPGPGGQVRDKVHFPIWAVAIVVLSLLVMLVLIVVLMY